MTTPIHLINEYYAVEVPDKIDNPNFYRVNNESIMFAWDDIERPLNPHNVVKVDTYIGDLNNYEWPKFLFTTKDCSEEELKVMDNLFQHPNFKEWFINFESRNSYFITRKESLESLLRSKGLNPKNNYAILEII